MAWRDALLALVVLSLTFLNFGHTSAVFAAGGRVVVTATSICGDPLSAPAGDHFACHACRHDLPALPPAPTGVEPVCFAVAPVAYAEAVRPTLVMALPDIGNARAPPSV